MLKRKRFFAALLLVTSFALPVMITGCSARVGVGYRVHDPYYRDDHVWNDGERVYYDRWAAETHRDSHRDFRKLKKDEQKDYWDWRHKQH